MIFVCEEKFDEEVDAKVYTYNETLCCSLEISEKSSIGKCLEEIALQDGCRVIIWSQWLALKKVGENEA